MLYEQTFVAYKREMKFHSAHRLRGSILKFQLLSLENFPDRGAVQRFTSRQSTCVRAMLALLSLGTCLVDPSKLEAQNSPSITAIADQAIYPNAATAPIQVIVNDLETPAAALTLTASSSNTNLLPQTGIVFGGFGSNRTVVLTPSLNQRGTSTVAVVVSDYDGQSSSNSFVLRVEEFSPIEIGPARGPSRIMWGDFDNDGWLDLTCAGAGTAAVFRNLGDGTFSNILSAFPQYGSQRGQAVWGDYDRDGFLDLVLAGYVNTTFCRNLGNGTFTNVAPGIFLPQLHWFAGAVSWGDCDNDGDLDLLMSGEDVNYSPISKVFRNEGPNRFVDMESGLVGVQGPSALADFDRDGRLDVVVTGFSLGNGRMTRLYRNLGNGVFSEAPVNLPLLQYGSGDMSIAWGDFDNDGDPDLFLSGDDGSGIYHPRLFRNDGSSQFTEFQIGMPNYWSQGRGETITMMVGWIWQ